VRRRHDNAASWSAPGSVRAAGHAPPSDGRNLCKGETAPALGAASASSSAASARACMGGLLHATLPLTAGLGGVRSLLGLAWNPWKGANFENKITSRLSGEEPLPMVTVTNNSVR
jgi:hypothetical protein